jgi:hypothetical protein
MDIDDDDDFYAADDADTSTAQPVAPSAPTSKPGPDDLEEGEEEDEGAMDEDEDDSVSFRSRSYTNTQRLTNSIRT